MEKYLILAIKFVIIVLPILIVCSQLLLFVTRSHTNGRDIHEIRWRSILGSWKYIYKYQ